MEIIGDKAESSTTSSTSSFPPFAPTRQQSIKQQTGPGLELGYRCYLLRIVILVHHGRRRGGVRIHLQDGVRGGPFDFRLFIQNEDLAPR